MPDPTEAHQGSLIVVKEEPGAVHLLWALMLALTLGGWWALVTFVEMTGENRIAGNVVGGSMTAIFTGMWIYATRYPARLEISHGSIVQRRRGRTSSVAIHRTTGDLAFEVRTMVLGGHGAVAPVLAIPGDLGSQIGIANYDRMRVRQACESVGWRFADSEG